MTPFSTLASRAVLTSRILLTLVGGMAAMAALVGPGPQLVASAWLLMGGTALILWAAYLPLEFALVCMVCGLIGALWDVGWREWLGGEVTGPGSGGAFGLIGMLSAFPILTVRLESYRRGSRSLAGAPIAVVGLGLLLTLVFLERASARSVSLQLVAAALFAPLGSDILLFQGNRRGTPSLKHLLGGLWISIYLTLAQTALLVIVAPYALLFTRERWGLVRRQCANGMRFMFDSFPYGRFERVGFEGTVFDRPAVLVSNHQSSVDIPLILSLPADVRLLVSRRVWRTPVLGIGARFLAHVLVETDHPETTLERCGERLAAGASVHGFPEGTRSQGAFPSRFRRGAFEIARELQVDVLPIVLCNTRSCVSRDAFWVGDFWMSLKALPRVTPQTFDYSLGSNELRKHVQELVRDTVEAENRRIYSDLKFLRAQVDGLYRYQTRALRRLVRRRLQSAGELQSWHAALQSRRRLLVHEDGPGVTSHLLSLPNLRMTCVGWLCDEGQLAVARRSAAGNEKLSFVGADGGAALDTPFDGIVLGRGTVPEALEVLLGDVEPGTIVFLEEPGEGMEVLLGELGFEPHTGVPRAYEFVASPVGARS